MLDNYRDDYHQRRPVVGWRRALRYNKCICKRVLLTTTTEVLIRVNGKRHNCIIIKQTRTFIKRLNLLVIISLFA